MTGTGALFTGERPGRRLQAGIADATDMAALPGYGEPGALRDMLDPWLLIALREDCRATTVHLLGWRRGLGNTWITSPLTAADFGAGIVLTRSGRVYGLAGAALPSPGACLLDHLRYALETWGWCDVQPSG